MGMNILYVLSGNLSTTPRAIKSIKTAKLNHNVDVLFVNRSNTWLSLDKLLIEELKINSYIVSLGWIPIHRWLISSIIQKFCQFISPFYRLNLLINAFASSKTSLLLSYKLSEFSKNYDLVIAHSYGAMFPVYSYAIKNRISFGVDIEDYYPGEVIAENALRELKRREFLMLKVIPKAAFYTSASPLIGKHVEQLVGSLEQSAVILNVFSKEDFKISRNIVKNPNEIRFIWFSQNISFGRGLEIFFYGLLNWLDKNPSANVSVTLVGNMYFDFDEFLTNKILNDKNKSQLKINHLTPLLEKELFQKISYYDVGLALEPGSNLNNRIAISNKIIAYAQAGLFILATDTEAQQEFLKSYPSIGIYCTPNINGFENSLDFIWSNKTKIQDQYLERKNITKDLCWEEESKKIIELWS
jgi:hypothetical protein